MIPGVAAVPFGQPATPVVVVTLNPAATSATGVLSNGNLTLSKPSVGFAACSRATASATAGLRYFEARLDTVSGFAPVIGVQTAAGDLTTDIGQDSAEYAVRRDGSRYFNGSFQAGWTSSSSAGDVFMLAVNFTTKKIWFGRNGTWLNAGDPAADTNPATTFTTTAALFPTVQTDVSAVVTARFSLASFSFSPPAGFTTW